MKSNYLKIIFGVLFFTVSVHSQKSLFEEEFGEINFKNLNLLVVNFEKNILAKSYPNVKINEAYKMFLKDYVNDKINLKDKKFNVGHEILEKYNLTKSIYNVLDSVWIGQTVITNKVLNDKSKVLIFRRKGVDKKGVTNYTFTETSATLVEKKKKLFRKKEININGLYFFSLKKARIKEIDTYVEYIELSGSFPAKLILASNILLNKIDTNNYFVKVVILTNIVYL